MKTNWINLVSVILATQISVVLAEAAESIVDFTHQDGTHRIRPVDVDSSNGDIWNFSDEELLFNGAQTVNDSNTTIYGGLQTAWNGTAYVPALQLRDSDDRLQLRVDAGTSWQALKGILVWRKNEFLNHSEQTVVFDFDSSMSLNAGSVSGSTEVRFVVNSGGIYYVSQMTSTGTMTLTDPGSQLWAPVYTDDYSIGMYAVRTFSDIRAVGIYIDQNRTDNHTLFQLTDFQVSASTPTVFRVDDYGATPDNDSDNDGGNIANCIDAAKNHANGTGPAVVRFSPGTYHISDQFRLFNVSGNSGEHCLIIDGNGCTLMNTHSNPVAMSFTIRGSDNVTCQDMTIRSERCMWVEGEIVAVNTDGTYDVQLRPDSPAFDAWGTIERGAYPDAFGFAWPCAKGLYSASPIGGSSFVFVTTAEDLGEGRWRVTGFDDGVTGVGDTYAMWNDWTHYGAFTGDLPAYNTFYLNGSDNVELRDITVMAGSKMGLMAMNQSHNIVVHRFVTLPDRDRSVAIARDGLHFNGCNNVLVRECVIGFNGDDAINATGGTHYGKNMVIEDSLFCYSRRHALLDPGEDHIFRNNLVYYMGGASFMVSESAPQNVIFADNEVYSSKRNPIWTEVELRDYSDVTVINNRFFECEYRLLSAVNGDNLVFENNHIDRGNRDTDDYIARLDNAANTRLVGNTTATENDGLLIRGSTTLTADSQNVFGHDTEPTFDHRRVFSMLGWTTPQVLAGYSQTIVLPDNEVIFTGTAVDTGTIINLEWVQDSGPSTATLSGVGSLTLTASDLVVGTYVFSLIATDDEGNVGSDTVSVVVNENTAPTIITSALPAPSATVSYRQQLQLNEGEAPFAWSLQSGSLPNGLSLSSSGVISGTPVAEMTSNFIVRVTDKDLEADDQLFTLTVGAAPTTQTLSFDPTEDAYLQSGIRFDDTLLKVEQNHRISYLKFELSGVPETIEGVILSMVVSEDAGEGTVNFYAGSHSNWTETNITSVSAPTKGALLGSISGVFNLNTEYSVDVSELLNAQRNGVYTIIVEMTGTNDIWFSSSEGAFAPTLAVTYDRGSPPTEDDRIIVDFTHQDGTHLIRDPDVDSTSGDIWNFSDDKLLFNGAETGNDSNTNIYGGLTTSWEDISSGYVPQLRLQGNGERLQLQVNAETDSQRLVGVLIWRKDTFLDHLGDAVIFGAESSIRMARENNGGSTTVKFIVNDGGTYYASNTTGSGNMELENLAAETWATIDLTTYEIDETSYALRSFTDIRAVGFRLEQSSGGQTNFKLTDFQVSASASESIPVGIELADIFASGCVLQREQIVPIWGTATPGDVITVEINGQTKQGVADWEGRWRIELDPETAGGPYTLSVEGGVSGSVDLTQVYFGDVWIMTGQSNMAEKVRAQVIRDFPDYYPAVPSASDNFDDMRFALVKQISMNTPADDVVLDSSWRRWAGNALEDMSAVGYFFARYLNEQMDANEMANVPLGFIRVAAGGSAIEEWIAEDALTAAKVANSGLIIASDASGYYNGMLAPIQDYAIKGAIWYQGEANSAPSIRIEQYPVLKETLLSSWRDQWSNPDMPFYFVQLAPYRSYDPLPTDELWAWMRESQESCRQFPNTGMACIIDSGFQGKIHPPFKDRVGERLARLALDQTYGIPTVHRGPTLQGISISGSAATITFDNVALGLETRTVDSQPDADEIAEGYRAVSVSSGELAGFFLCGADQKFYPALEATITSSNQVRISNTVDVPSPVAVRYAFQDFPRCNLFNSEGLPAEPFRTDSLAFSETSAETNEYTIWKYDTQTPAQLGEAISDPDTDTDGMSLFLEYALGGDPLVPDSREVLPMHALSTGNLSPTYLYFTHNERTDDPSLTYTVERRSDLLSGDWSTSGLEFVEEIEVDDGWKSVTNRTLVENKEFVRLRVEDD